MGTNKRSLDITVVIQYILYPHGSGQPRLTEKYLPAMIDIERLHEIDRILMRAIARDVLNGSLLEADDQTLELVLQGIWEDPEAFEERGVVIGQA